MTEVSNQREENLKSTLVKINRRLNMLKNLREELEAEQEELERLVDLLDDQITEEFG